jgi:hypothetical protein
MSFMKDDVVVDLDEYNVVVVSETLIPQISLYSRERS